MSIDTLISANSRVIEGTRKVDMLSTIVLSLLTVWLTLMIITTAGYIMLSYGIFKSFNYPENK